MAIFYKITHEDANFDLIPQGAEYDALMPILKKALAKNLDERYQTAYEFAVDLREWLKAHATTTSSQNVLEALVDLEAPTHAPVPMTEAGRDPRAARPWTSGRAGGRRSRAGPRWRRRAPAEKRCSTPARTARPAPARPVGVAADSGPRPARRPRRASCPGWRWGSRSSRSASRAFSP